MKVKPIGNVKPPNERCVFLLLFLTIKNFLWNWPIFQFQASQMPNWLTCDFSNFQTSNKVKLYYVLFERYWACLCFLRILSNIIFWQWVFQEIQFMEVLYPNIRCPFIISKKFLFSCLLHMYLYDCKSWHMNKKGY